MDNFSLFGRCFCLVTLSCEPFSPLQPSTTPETPNLSKICPSDCFGGFQSGGLKFEKICQNLKNGNSRTNFDKFFQISVPLTGTPQNNRWDKFWTKLGFRAFLKAVRGKRVRKPCPMHARYKKRRTGKGCCKYPRGIF